MGIYRPIPMPGKIKLRGRALLGVALEAGYVIFLIAVILACWWTIYMMIFHWQFKNVWVMIALAATSLGLLPGLWVVIPKYRPFGLEVHPEQHPRLWEESRAIAKMVGTRPADRIFLNHRVNAGVIERGGFLGIGTKRALVIGLGMISVLDVNQLRVVLAHEYGHYAHGDPRLSAWIVRTARRIKQTGGYDEESGCIGWFNVIYMAIIAKVMASVSRLEEYAANEVAINHMGRTLFLEVRRITSVAAYLENKFWDQGARNAIRDGLNYFEVLRGYIASAEEQGAMPNIELKLGQSPLDPYDTHPGYGELVAFARAFPDKSVARDKRPARELLDDPDAVEWSLTKWMRVLLSL